MINVNKVKFFQIEENTTIKLNIIKNHFNINKLSPNHNYSIKTHCIQLISIEDKNKIIEDKNKIIEDNNVITCQE